MAFCVGMMGMVTFTLAMWILNKPAMIQATLIYND